MVDTCFRHRALYSWRAIVIQKSLQSTTLSTSTKVHYSSPVPLTRAHMKVSSFEVTGFRSASQMIERCLARQGGVSPRQRHRQGSRPTSKGGRVVSVSQHKSFLDRRKTSAYVGESRESVSVTSETTESPKILPKDLERYESLFHKYSCSDQSQEVIKIEQFHELMKDLESRTDEVNWDDRFIAECKNYSVAEYPKVVLSLLYNRFICGEDKKASAKGIFLSCLGIFVAFLSLSSVANYMMQYSSLTSSFHKFGAPFMLGSFGTLSILVFGHAGSANLRIWNVVIGHIIGATCGFISVKLLGYSSLATALAMTSTLAAMLWTGAIHPPGGAIALLMVVDARLQIFQHWYILYPALFGAVILYLVGFLTNRLKKHFSVP